MSFNPFLEKTVSVEKTFMNWDQLQPRSYDKAETDPYTKCRIILMNGTEFEAQWFSRNFSRHCHNNELRRELAMTRRSEQQQQKRISGLKPKNETILEHTISYEQLAVDLTAALAKQETDCNVINALNFALLEDFDHLYRYGNLLHLEYGIYPEKLTGGYTEITPGRPTISEHRYPKDSISQYTDYCGADLKTKLHVGIITAAEQQTMNYYMNTANLYRGCDLGRRLYQEIAMIEEQHVSQYESLADPTVSWLESLLLHEYTECYLYYSCMLTETDEYIRRIWEECFVQEIAHLQKANELLKKYENRDYCEVIGEGTFPEILRLGSNIGYVRRVLETTAGNTQKNENIVPLSCLEEKDPFFRYQKTVHRKVSDVASHRVIDQHICCEGKDYRDETDENPVKELRCRTNDNTDFARIQEKTPDDYSVCGTTADRCCCNLTEECCCFTDRAPSPAEDKWEERTECWRENCGQSFGEPGCGASCESSRESCCESRCD